MADDIKKMITNACELIDYTIDKDMSQVEKSNSFGEWLYLIDTIFQDLKQLCNSSIKTIGLLIDSCRGKDISDFTEIQLNFLKNSTYELKKCLME